MLRAIASLGALTLVVALTGPDPANAAGKKTGAGMLSVFKQWSGWYRYPKDSVKLPWFEAKQEHGIIDNNKTFETVWKVWSKEEDGPTPKVDFQKYLVLFQGKDTAKNAINVFQVTMKDFLLDEEGTLSFKVEKLFAIDPPAGDGVIFMHMVVLPRANIKAVNTGNGVFEIPPPPSELKKTSAPKAPQRFVALLSADEAEDRAVTFIQGFGGKVDRSEVDGPITVVVLKGAPVTDSDLKQLTVLKALRILSLQGTRVTDAGLKDVAAFKELKEFDLRATKVTGAGLKGLAGLKALRWLDLAESKITAAHLKDLAALDALEELNLGNTAITGADLKELAALKELRWLSLSGLKMADADLKGLAPLTELRTLFLFGTAVTDKGLKELAPLKRLRLVDVGETKVTGDGIAWLTKVLPDCEFLR